MTGRPAGKAATRVQGSIWAPAQSNDCMDMILAHTIAAAAAAFDLTSAPLRSAAQSFARAQHKQTIITVYTRNRRPNIAPNGASIKRRGCAHCGAANELRCPLGALCVCVRARAPVRVWAPVRQAAPAQPPVVATPAERLVERARRAGAAH